MAEPTRPEVLQWLSLTGRPQNECITELWGPLSDDQRRRVEARVRQWVRRARTGDVPVRVAPPPAAQLNGPRSAVAPSPRVASPPKATPPPRAPRVARAAPTPATPPARVVAPPPDEHETRVDFLRRQLAQLEDDVAAARSTHQLRLVPQLDRRISDVRADLDLELERERRVVSLPRTPPAICARLREVAPAVALRAEMHRRAVERAAREDSE